MLDAHGGEVPGSSERLRTCLDTLLENAIRYASAGDTIRLVGTRQGQHFMVSVLDTGVGLSDDQIVAINAGEHPALTAPTAVTNPVPAENGDRLAGTGLGLSIAREAAHARGGTLHASHAAEGGAAMTLTYPVDPPDDVGQFHERRRAPRLVPAHES